MIYAAILAGGSGTRMGADKPKQFLEFGGKPVIIHTIEKFVSCSAVDRIIVMTPSEWCEYTRKILKEYLREVSVDMAGPDYEKADAKILIAAGGSTRNETLMNAIDVIDAEGNLNDETIIITHDAVRPFVTERMILANIAAAGHCGACETAFPATDTIIESDDGEYVARVPDRSRLWMTQTPQSFMALELRRLYHSLTEDEKAVLTDAARIYIMKEKPVEIVIGESWNIKITYPGDIQIAEAILAGQETGM